MSDTPGFEPDEEADRHFDETIRRRAKMPPKPHEEMKLGKPRRVRSGPTASLENSSAKGSENVPDRR
jgi:hypothetical protein